MLLVLLSIGEDALLKILALFEDHCDQKEISTIPKILTAGALARRFQLAHKQDIHHYLSIIDNNDTEENVNHWWKRLKKYSKNQVCYFNLSSKDDGDNVEAILLWTKEPILASITTLDSLQSTVVKILESMYPFAITEGQLCILFYDLLAGKPTLGKGVTTFANCRINEFLENIPVCGQSSSKAKSAYFLRVAACSIDPERMKSVDCSCK